MSFVVYCLNDKDSWHNDASCSLKVVCNEHCSRWEGAKQLVMDLSEQFCGCYLVVGLLIDWGFV